MTKQFYYLTASKETVGPIPQDVMMQLHRAGTLTDETLVAPEGSEDWRKFTEVMSQKEGQATLPPLPGKSIAGSTPIVSAIPPVPTANEQVPSPQKTSKAAIFSLILGILSNLFLWILGSIPAIILGIVAIKKINRNPSAIRGKGLAIAGIITGGTGLISGSVVFSILFLGVAAYNKGANRSKCILQMATIEKLVISHGNIEEIAPGEDIAPSVLVDEGYLPEPYKCPEGGTYTYTGKMPSGESGTTAYTRCDIEGHDFDPWPQK